MGCQIRLAQRHNLPWRAGEGGASGGGEPARQAYRGVTRLERERKWVARVWNGQKQLTLGRFETDVAAAQVLPNPLSHPCRHTQSHLLCSSIVALCSSHAQLCGDGQLARVQRELVLRCTSLRVACIRLLPT